MKKAERKRAILLANLGDINRPVRVRPVRVLNREWWAINPDDIWPGMVMDLRRLGFEAMAWEAEVLVRAGSLAYEPQMEGPAALGGLKPFPLIQPTIHVYKETYSTGFADLSYLDEFDNEEGMEEEDEFDNEEGMEEEDEFEPEDLSEE